MRDERELGLEPPERWKRMRYAVMALVGAALGLPLSVNGLPVELPSGLRYLAVDETYFSTIGLPIVSGRGFTRSDAPDGSVAVLSESLARLIAGGDDAVGKRRQARALRRRTTFVYEERINSAHGASW